MALPQRIAFSGLLKSGKDYVASKIGYTPVSFAEPLYHICQYVYGSCDKNNPRHRKFLQWVGQAGWGCKDEEHCPDDFHKAAIVILLRREGPAIYPHQCWQDFGTRSDFWVIDLLERVANYYSKHNVVVTNVRFRHELEPMKAGGFEHYLVVCSPRTRRERYWNDMAKGIIPIPKHIDEDVSEQMARDLLGELPDERIIWNDHRSMPKGKKYLTVEEFCKQ
jgi:hypothetical protein